MEELTTTENTNNIVLNQILKELNRENDIDKPQAWANWVNWGNWVNWINWTNWMNWMNWWN